MTKFDEASFRAGYEWACGPDGLPKGSVDGEVARLLSLSSTQWVVDNALTTTPARNTSQIGEG